MLGVTFVNQLRVSRLELNGDPNSESCSVLVSTCSMLNSRSRAKCYKSVLVAFGNPLSAELQTIRPACRVWDFQFVRCSQIMSDPLTDTDGDGVLMCEVMSRRNWFTFCTVAHCVSGDPG